MYKGKSKMPFNSMGIISGKAGEEVQIDSPVTFLQLQANGFIEPIEVQAKPTAKSRAAKQ